MNSARLRHRAGRPAVLLAALAAGTAWAATPAAEPVLASAAPAAVGLSAERLARLDRYVTGEVAAGRKAGAVVLIARRGHLAYLKAYGEADVAAHRPMRTDALFRLQSMTKPVTSVALLTLYEQGLFQLTDPLSKYLPEFAGVKVVKEVAADGSPVLEDPVRPITIEDVFRHTAGFSYGYFGDTPVDRAYRAAGLAYSGQLSLRAFAAKLATMPLLYQPGTRWHYSFAHDVQAALVEHFSGMPFDAYCQKAIFGPLQMKDTVFGVPPAKQARFASIYHPGPDGRILPGDNFGADSYAGFTGHPYGGASLSSTPADYLRFAQMLLNGGRLGPVRILSRKTVELMTADHLAPAIPPVRPGLGYGLGVGVLTSPAEAQVLGSAGAFTWGGYATTRAVMDPKEQLVALVFAQYQPQDGEFLDRTMALIYQSIAD
ncbi:MAG: beta-lactamase family protein [Proteobacteria bacterium]|nr:beta-lactamase family protein [Pseudomonadota bacterium]